MSARLLVIFFLVLLTNISSGLSKSLSDEGFVRILIQRFQNFRIHALKSKLISFQTSRRYQITTIQIHDSMRCTYGKIYEYK